MRLDKELGHRTVPVSGSRHDAPRGGADRRHPSDAVHAANCLQQVVKAVVVTSLESSEVPCSPTLPPAQWAYGLWKGHVHGQIVGSHHLGPEAPTRAALGLLVARAGIEEGHDVSIFLAGDAVQLIRDAVLDSLTGLGTGSLRESFTRSQAEVDASTCLACRARPAG